MHMNSSLLSGRDNYALAICEKHNGRGDLGANQPRWESYRFYLTSEEEESVSICKQHTLFWTEKGRAG